MPLSSQNDLNSGVVWLPWLSRTSSLLLPIDLDLVCLSKWWIHCRPTFSVVHPFPLTENVHVEGRPWKNHVWLNSFPLMMMNGGIKEPSAHAPWFNVTHSVLVGLICFGLPGLSKAVDPGSHTNRNPNVRRHPL
jgi:hypothetical protein